MINVLVCLEPRNRSARSAARTISPPNEARRRRVKTPRRRRVRIWPRARYGRSTALRTIYERSVSVLCSEIGPGTTTATFRAIVRGGLASRHGVLTCRSSVVSCVVAGGSRREVIFDSILIPIPLSRAARVKCNTNVDQAQSPFIY